jgi:hypothetical protein
MVDFGGPGLFSMGLVALILAIVLGYWVYTDATKRSNDNALFWGLGVGILTLLTLLGGILAFVIYLWKR